MYIGKNIIDKSNPIPLYLQIVNWIEEMIKDGNFSVGSKLPSEGRLSQALDINRNTVRHAIAYLVNRGLLEKRKGVGTFVKREDPVYPIHQLGKMASFIDDFNIDGLEVKDKVLFKGKIKATSEVADKLLLDREEWVIKIERVRMAEKIPFVYERQFYSFNDFGKLLDMNIAGSMYELLIREFDADLDHSVQTIQTLKPTNDIAQKLLISRAIPCIYIESLAYTSADRCIEVLQSYYRGDRYIFQVETGRYSRGMSSTEI